MAPVIAFSKSFVNCLNSLIWSCWACLSGSGGADNTLSTTCWYCSNNSGIVSVPPRDILITLSVYDSSNPGRSDYESDSQRKSSWHPSVTFLLGYYAGY